MRRPSPLPAGDAVGLLAAMVETPLLADLVPVEVFPPHSAMRALHHIIVWDYVRLDFRGEEVGFRIALHELLRARREPALEECLDRAIDTVRAWPALRDSGRARLVRYAAGSGRLLDDPGADAPKVSRLAADGLRLHGEATAA